MKKFKKTKMVIKDDIRALIAQRIKDTGTSMMAVSVNIGANPAYIQQYLERGVPQNLPEIKRERIAEELDIDPQKLKIPTYAGEKMNLNTKNSRSIGEVQFGPDLVPVLGAANGSGEALVLNFSDPIGEVPRHPNQAGMQKAFALYARGSSMSPRYRDGELIYVVSNRRPVRGQDCIVEMVNGESFIKEFVKTNEKELICEQLNPHKEWKRSLPDVKAIHAIVGRG